MGRRTPRATIRGAVAAALFGAVAALPGLPAAAAGAASGSGYAFDPADRSLTAAATSADAGLLEPGAGYRSTLPPSGKTYYRLDLEAAPTAYVAVTAVPPAGSDVAVTDGVRVALQDADSHYCSTDTASFGAARSARPITAWGVRQADHGRSACRGAGTYYVVVERLRTSSSPAADDTFDLELTAATEPALQEPGPTSAPDAWNSASPAPQPGTPRALRGGAGFATAAPMGQGVWSATAIPGQTLFYKVPLDWGQQLSATAELGSTRQNGSGLVAGALGLSLYNPVRGPVADATANYGGSQKSAALAALPPVDYRNRYAVHDTVSGMRFAGSYYLAVHLSSRVAERYGDGPFALTLRVRVEGAPRQPGPGYAGGSTPKDVFRVTDRDRQAAAAAGSLTGGLPTGTAGAAGAAGDPAAAGDGTAMRALAAGGIGTGTLLLAVLGGWAVVARRRASASAQTRVSAQKPTA
ncbi:MULTISPECIES: hypothetical protein [unclassified Streptomyces]|uniref:hypothetical protein n=1 Tax=unclassified Streptomyces TaxID=2593676 RepID=UPI001F039DF9|nr:MULTISPECIES: hypothetical protein [unclassified Streptomyces]MCH0564381.1 hypothetical protein [Streptomyces sp. MUM 2J]MCH0569408.1 hypothetical protein [Streptomyces sp. MUM 136J]